MPRHRQDPPPKAPVADRQTPVVRSSSVLDGLMDRSRVDEQVSSRAAGGGAEAKDSQGRSVPLRVGGAHPGPADRVDSRAAMQEWWPLGSPLSSSPKRRWLSALSADEADGFDVEPGARNRSW